MGKEKQHRSEPPVGAFTRMNYLYQAGYLMAETSPYSPLCNYYNNLMKEISKKVVEKLHPDVKRTVCSACNYSLTGGCNQAKVKIKSSKRKKRKGKVSEKDGENVEKVKNFKTSESSCSGYKKCRLEVRKKKPNKLKVDCCRCGFSKSYLLKPSYELWIHRIENNQ